MKTFFVALALTGSVAIAAEGRHQNSHHKQHSSPAAQDEKKAGQKPSQKDKTATGDAADAKGATPAGDVVKRGEPLGDSATVAFKDVFKDPQKYAGKVVRIEGVVERVCKAEGCWMQIAPAEGSEESVRVTFDHKFSVPKDADKWKFRAEGEFSVKVLSKETVEHLVKDDGARIKTNPDGTANEISFVATGVELWK